MPNAMSMGGSTASLFALFCFVWLAFVHILWFVFVYKLYILWRTRVVRIDWMQRAHQDISDVLEAQAWIALVRRKFQLPFALLGDQPNSLCCATPTKQTPKILNHMAWHTLQTIELNKK